MEEFGEVLRYSEEEVEMQDAEVRDSYEVVSMKEQKELVLSKASSNPKRYCETHLYSLDEHYILTYC